MFPTPTPPTCESPETRALTGETGATPSAAAGGLGRLGAMTRSARLKACAVECPSLWTVAGMEVAGVRLGRARLSA